MNTATIKPSSVHIRLRGEEGVLRVPAVDAAGLDLSQDSGLLHIWEGRYRLYTIPLDHIAVVEYEYR